MDDLEMRKKNSPNSPTKIKELLLQLTNMNVENDKVSQKLEDNDRKYADLTKELSVLKEEYELEKQKLENKKKEYEEHNHILQDLKEEKQNLELNCKELETKCKCLKKTKISVHDEQILERGKQKLKLYKELTGIRWDYSVVDSRIQGYITNKKDFLENILYANDEDTKIVCDSIWKTIERSTKGKQLSEEN